MQWFADLRIAYKIAMYIVPLALSVLLVVLGVVSSVRAALPVEWMW